MARIAGINIPPHKHAEIGLTAIYGIGRSTARKICESCGIEYSKKIKDLTDAELEKIRDLINGMLEISLSSASNRLNEVMKVLTVFATIFIPLTFLVGVYGMNFDYMPELRWKWSYPILWLLFFLIPAVLLLWFRRKKWL